MPKSIQFILLLIIIAGCNTANKTGTMKVGEKKYMYSDGSANRYLISRDSFEYIPVKPAESSSGQYDGGEAIKRQTDSQWFDGFVELIDSAANAKTDHTTERGKGTGRVEIIEGANTTSFILRMNSKWRAVIEDLLLKMRTEK